MTGELHLNWEIREGSLEEVILCGGTSKMNGRLTRKQRERSLGGLWSRGSGKQKGEAFEELKECQSCKVIGGKGSRTHGVLGTVLGGPDATPPRRGVGTIVPVSQVRRTWIAVTRPSEPGFQGPTLFALYPPAPPSPHPTPVNSWEVTVTFAEGQLGKGGGPSLLFLSPRGI